MGDVWYTSTDGTVYYMGMFRQCYVLKSLDISNFDISNVTDMHSMFQFCHSLKTIYTAATADWSGTTADSTDMFTGCSALVGGNGTAYNASSVTAAYARVDGLNGAAGYFTAKE